MDEELSWRENLNKILVGLYHKKFELARGYLNACEMCRVEDHHIHYRYYQCDQLVSQDYIYNLKWNIRCECRKRF